MRVLFTIGNAHIPQAFGGIQSSTDQLARRMRAIGWEVAVSCRLSGGDRSNWRSRLSEFVSRSQRSISGNRFSRDGLFTPYPVFRAWDETDVTEVLERFQPDVVLVQQGARVVELVRHIAAKGIPTVIYFRDAELYQMDGDPSEFAQAHFIANSEFTARKYKAAYGITSIVIPPLVETRKYATETTRETVTLVNPDVRKGGEVALSIARLCPEIPFTFVESWLLSDDARKQLANRLVSLPNVTFRGRTHDMKSVYSRTRVLLAPSQWEEAWGRVASEAHCSGIPVLGSNRGGLPEAIGPGGTILPFDAPAEEWAAALRRMWHDEDEYKRLSEAAYVFGRRPEMNPDYQFVALTKLLEHAVNA